MFNKIKLLIEAVFIIIFFIRIIIVIMVNKNGYSHYNYCKECVYY